MVARTVLKLVIFDVDGTLYRSEPYEKHLLEKIIETLSEMLGASYETAARLLTNKKKFTKTVSGAVEMLGLDRGEFYERLASRVDVEQHIRPDPRLPEFLKSLRRRGFRVALHTNSGRRLAAKVLNALGVDEKAYDLLVTSDDSPPKPLPEGYQKILTHFGVQSHEAIYVGDRYEVELLPARRLGMRTALIGKAGSPVQSDYVLDSIFDLYALLQ